MPSSNGFGVVKTWYMTMKNGAVASIGSMPANIETPLRL